MDKSLHTSIDDYLKHSLIATNFAQMLNPNQEAPQ
jgi:hypothetical protein